MSANDLPDVDVIMPQTGATVTIDGIECTVNRLKSREFLALLRVVTTGLGESIAEASRELDLDDEQKLGQQLMGLLVVSIPEAVDEFLTFVRVVVTPTKPGATTVADLAAALDNPDLEVLLDVAEKVVEQEKDDLSALAGKARAAWTRIAALYQPKKPTTTSRRRG
jgi:hypothetical protein